MSNRLSSPGALVWGLRTSTLPGASRHPREASAPRPPQRRIGAGISAKICLLKSWLSHRCHYFSFQALSAVWRILSHCEWVPSCNVRAADPCYRPLPGRLAASSQLGVCKDRGSPRRGRRSSSSFSYPERNKRAGRRGVGPSAPPCATTPALWAPRAFDVAAPPPSFRGSGGSRPCLPTRSRRLPPGRPHYRLCTWKGPQAGFGETPSPGGSGVAGPSGSRGSA